MSKLPASHDVLRRGRAWARRRWCRVTAAAASSNRGAGPPAGQAGTPVPGKTELPGGTSSWQDYHRRARVVDGVLHDAAASGDYQIPARWQPQIRVAFGGDGGLVGALYHRWFAALTARLDPLLEAPPADLPAAAAQAARQLARERPALFGLLSACAGHPVLAAAREREKRSLGWAPGAQLATLAAHPAAGRDA